MSNIVRVGTSGYSFKDWLGEVYPSDLKEREMLPYYEQEMGFDTVEINFTYYRQPTARTLDAMSRKTAENFGFVVKANRKLTHDMLDPNTWRYADNEPAFEEFLKGIQPIVENGKLICVLAQFPPYFQPRPPAFDYLKKFKDQMAQIPVVVEFRSRAWLNDEAFQFLEKSRLGYCVVDEPADRFPKLVPYEPRRTSKIAYFRMHGRSENWYNSSEDRYNYLYSQDELKSFLPGIGELAGQAEQTLVFFNNCHAGAAARNAAMMKELLGQDVKKPWEQIEKSRLDLECRDEERSDDIAA
jgi:uncharacterized protein YecE (DUF72 family)